MRKLFCPIVLAFAGFVPGAHAHISAPVQALPMTLIVPMPEPWSPALLAVDLLAVGVLVFLFRRRTSGTNR